MLRAAIFDLGDTLIYVDRPWDEIRESRIKGLHESLSARGFDVHYSVLKDAYTQIAEADAKYCESTLNEIPIGETLNRVLSQLGIHRDDEDFMNDIVVGFFASEVDSWKLYADVPSALREVRRLGLKLGMISNTRSDLIVRNIASGFGIDRLFDAIVTSAQLGIRKPRPEIFQAALRALEVYPHEAVMIGDSLEADIVGAKRLGLRAIHLRRRGHAFDGAVDPDGIASNLGEAVGLIKKMLTEVQREIL